MFKCFFFDIFNEKPARLLNLLLNNYLTIEHKTHHALTHFSDITSYRIAYHKTGGFLVMLHPYSNGRAWHKFGYES